jgi:hypothetical protein
MASREARSAAKEQYWREVIDGWRRNEGSVDRTQKSALEMDMQGSQEANGTTFVVWVEMSRATVESYTEIKK